MGNEVPIRDIFEALNESGSVEHDSYGYFGDDEMLGQHKPPQSFDAEKGILCSILIDPDAMEAVQAESIIPEDFHHPHHALIFQCMLELYDRNEPIDTVMVANELLSQGKLEASGGAKTLAAIETFLPTSAAVSSYARLVKGKSALRRLIQSAKKIVESAYKQAKDVSDILDEAEQIILSIREKTAKHGVMSLKELSKLAVVKYELLVEQKNRVTGIPSGFVDLDNLTSGFQPGELVVIAARPSMGKTAFTLNIAAHVGIMARQPVAFFSLEMGAEQLFHRLIGAHAGINLSSLRCGFINAEDYGRLVSTAAELGEAPMYIDETASLSIGELRNKARRMVHQYQVKLIIIDYLQLMSGPARLDNKAVEVGEISKGLKSIARELKIPVIALSQLNRGVESRTDKRPMMSDLRESGAIEQDADVIAFLYREEYYLRDKTPEDKRHIAEVIIAKNRNGPTGNIELKFESQFTRFASLDRNHT